MSTFALQLAEFAKKAGANADKVVKKVVIDIGTSLVMKSPVGDPSYWQHPAPPGYVGGRFRANWQYSLNRVPFSTTKGIDPEGSATIAGIVEDVKLGPGVHYITNSLPYADALETGHSRQAPNGMVGLTVVEWRTFINKAVSELPA